MVNLDIKDFEPKPHKDGDTVLAVDELGQPKRFSVTDALPVGSIIMWGGDKDAIPSGWQICDGRDIGGGRRTPDLRGRFPVGYGANGNSVAGGSDVWDSQYSSPGIGSGGANRIAISAAQMPSHAHMVTNQWQSGTNSDSSNRERRVFYNGGNNLRYVQAYSTDSTGNGQPHENRPPFYVVVFIMKIY